VAGIAHLHIRRTKTTISNGDPGAIVVPATQKIGLFWLPLAGVKVGNLAKQPPYWGSDPGASLVADASHDLGKCQSVLKSNRPAVVVFRRNADDFAVDALDLDPRSS
jgi:hypothetical protein